MEDQIQCLLCGKQLSELNYHLSAMHGLSVSEYHEKHPNAPIISKTSAQRKSKGVAIARQRRGPVPIRDETRDKLAAASARRHQEERTRDLEGYLARQRTNAAKARDAKGDNYRHSPETIDKMRGPRPHTRGRKLSDETKRKLSKVRTGRKCKPHSPETIVKMKQAWYRRKADQEAYAVYLQHLKERMSTPQAKIRMRDRTAKLVKDGNHNGKSKDTKIELTFKAYLHDCDLAYEHQFILDTRKGAFTFDFFVPSLVLFVETDSEYYHTKSMEVWNRDVLKQRLADELGFTVARISDKDWHPEIIHDTQDAIRSHANALLERRYQTITARKAV